VTRRIALFTATRAEYGLLRPVARALAAHGGFEPLWLVGGAHLSPRLGGTVDEIEADGERISARLEGTAPDSDRPVAVAKAAAQTTTAVTEALASLRPDALMVLGDRTELLGAATAAVCLGVPLIHLEGGHVTEGAVDDRVRHAVSKLADLHFTAHPAYRDRLLQLGEPPDRVFAVGSTGVDDLRGAGPADLAAASSALDWSLAPGFLLVAWHPETLSGRDAGADARAVLDGVLAAAGQRRLVLTGPNADAGRDAVQAELERVAAAHPDRVRLYASLGRARWGKVLAAADALVGNSSAGVIEAPALGVPSVNAGDRQAGRLRPPGVIDCAPTAEAVAGALGRALDPAFRAALAPDPLADGRAAERIVTALAGIDLRSLARKPFVDRP
jgi:UDP-hydrolysing UDP-N-acetyl-D-glucosamine 2-epimerase